MAKRGDTSPPKLNARQRYWEKRKQNRIVGQLDQLYAAGYTTEQVREAGNTAWKDFTDWNPDTGRVEVMQPTQQQPIDPASLAPQRAQQSQIGYNTAPNGLLVKEKVKPAPTSSTFKSGKPLTNLQIAAGYGYEPTNYDTQKINAPIATVRDAVEGRANWNDVEISQRQKVLSDPKFYETGQINRYPKWMQQQILSDPAFKWEKLPKWQKTYYELSSSPAGMGAAQGALMGLGGGLVGSGAGAAIGGGLGYLAGKSGYDPTKEAWQQKGVAAKGFGFLNFLAEQAEKAVGIPVQAIGALRDEDPGTTLGDVFSKEGWNAGAVTFESLGPAVSQAVQLDVKDLKGADYLRVVPTFFYVTQLTDLMLHPEKYKGQELILGANDPVDLKQTFQERITEARERIAAGENYREVMTEFQNGVVGQISDMAGQAAIDPLNVMPRIETKVLGKVADVTGNKVAAEALRTATGPVEAARTYKTLVQTGQATTIDPAFRVDRMGALSRFVAGINKEGQVRAGPFNKKGLLDTPTPRKNLTGFVEEMTSLTPQARAQIGANMFYENIGALLNRFEDPHEAGKYLKALANSDMETWKELGSRFADSPEFYTVLPALKDYNTKNLDGLVQAWDMSATNRDMLTRVAEVLGDNPSKLLDDLTARGTAEQDFQRIVQRLQQSQTPQAAAILGDIQAGRFTPDTLKQIVDVFTGDGALPWHPGQWKAMVLDSMGSHFDEWVSNHLMLDQTPEAKSAFFRTASLMKTAQSILLLGGSPGYAITNGLSNMVHRAATGVFGYLTPNAINGWMDRFGVSPARFEEGVGIGGMVEQAATKTGVRTEAQRKATRGTGFLADAKDKLSKLSKGMPFSRLSSWFEKNEGRQAFSIAMRQFWSQSWRRGVGFQKMDTRLSQAIQAIGVDPNHIYAAIEAGMNQGEIEKALYSRAEGIQTRSLIDDAARRTGLTPQQAADMLEKVGVLDTLDDFLKGATTQDGVASAFRRADEIMQERIEQQTADDLVAIAEHVRQRVGMEGAASGLDVIQRANAAYTDTWLDHYFRFGEVMNDLSTLDDPQMRSKAIENNYAISDAEFRRVNARRGANYKGIFDAWGKSDNADVKEVLASIGVSDAAMKQAYDQVRKLRRDFFEKHKGEMTPEAWDEWAAIQRDADDVFKNAFDQKHRAEVRQGEALGRLYNQMFGESAGQAARKWWEDVTAFNDDIVKRERDFRAEMRRARTAGVPSELVNAQKQKYYRETKVQLIAEAEKINQEGIARLERSVRTGERTVESTSPILTPDILTNGTPEEMTRFLISRGIPDEVAGEYASSVRAKNEVKRLKELLKDETYGNESLNIRAQLEDAEKTSKSASLRVTNALKRNNMTRDGLNKTIYETPSVEIFQDADLPAGALDQASQFLPHSEVIEQGLSQFIRPLMDSLQETATERLADRPLDGAIRDLSPEGQAELRRYIKQVQNDMATSKLATVRYGEQQRDFAMLNYSKQYGFDRWLQAGWPYELYYTRSLATWGARVLDAPAWFSNYARLRMQQQRYERDIPERLRNKIKIPAPWMPDWMGDSLYIDPLGSLFTPGNFLRPFERMEQDKNYQQIEAERILQEWAADGQVSQNEIQQAAATRSGSVWERAFAEAQMRREAEIANPMDFFNTMFGPAWYLSTPLNLLGIKSPFSKGDPNKVSNLPLTNTARALDVVTQGTWAEPVGNLIGLIGKPEEWLRKKAGLPTMGEYGEYYTKRQVANMVAEGLITSEDASIAMIEKQGQIWDQATERVQLELAMRVPTAGAVYAGLHEGPKGLAQAALPTLFGSGLLPAGELEYRGLKQEWNEAWKKYDAGDKAAVTTFFDEHPEYEAYLAKGKSDDELMKSFMVGQIWDGYMALGPTNQKQARTEMGELFQQAFLDKETRSYESIDTDTLIQWAQQLNQRIPQAVNGQPLDVPEAPALDLYSEDVTRVSDEFFTQRTKYFGDYYELEQGYYALPKSQRGSYLLKNPELKEYWDWKDKWFDSYPELKPIFRGQVFKQVDTSAWPPGLVQYVTDYAYTGKKLSKGAYKALEQQWIMEGKPYDDMNTWLNSQVAPALLYGNQ